MATVASGAVATRRGASTARHPSSARSEVFREVGNASDRNPGFAEPYASTLTEGALRGC